MTRDDIIRMAREAGVPLACERFAALIAAEKDRQIAFLKDSHDAIRELAYKTGAEEEREACAWIAKSYGGPEKPMMVGTYDSGWFNAAEAIAADIRARGEK